MKFMRDNQTIHVVYACDDNYTLPLCCSIKSILSNANQQDKYMIYILNNPDNLSQEKKELIMQLETENCSIKFISADKKLFEKFSISNDCQHTTIETYYRFVLATTLKDVDKVIYIDCDTTVLTDLSDLYNINIEHKYLAACDDFSCKSFKQRLGLNTYVNAGVMLFNLKKIREDNIEPKLFEYALSHKNSIPFQDQDVMNVVFQDGIEKIDNSWNTQIAYYSLCDNYRINQIQQNAKIIHYICEIKPWQYEYKALFKILFFKYFEELPYNIKFLLLDFSPKENTV